MAELTAALNEVRDRISVHEATCLERNKSRDKFEVRIDHEINTIKMDLTNLKIKLALIAGTGATVGGGIGAAIANLFM